MDFTLEIIRQHWEFDDGFDDPDDLCSHGELYLKIGNELLADQSEGSFCLTATGLHLLRTLYNDYQPGEYKNQLIPCCGKILTLVKGKYPLHITGCPNGIDLSLKHKNKTVILKTAKGTTAQVSLMQYGKLVFDFVLKVEKFYGRPELKNLPKDPKQRKAFVLFWQEWQHLKQRA